MKNAREIEGGWEDAEEQEKKRRKTSGEANEEERD